jgi:serine/threonine protein phosphatase 1
MSKEGKTGESRRVDYVIGDVHGCYAELIDLLAEIYADAKGADVTIYFIGDLIDKGPESGAVLRLIEDDFLMATKFKFILGNHEEKFLRWCKAQDIEEAGGKKNQIVDRWKFQEIRQFKPLLEEAPLYIQLPEYNVLLVHGGIEPRMTELPPPTLMDANKHQKNVLRLRYISAEGRMIPLGEESLEQGDKWWADTYDGRFGTVIYGHQPYDKVAYHPHAIGIDTGCVFGNELTALRLEKDGNHKVISVKAKAKYAKSYTEEKWND